MDISIIIPTLNEAHNIQRLVEFLSTLSSQHYLREVIVTDGGSTDNTLTLAQKAGATVLQAPVRGRAAQMNYGAAKATGDMLYFVHADVLPPKTCLSDIAEAVTEGHTIGCFSYDFDANTMMLKLNAFLTTFQWMASGGGDQTFYIPKNIFEELDCFDESLPIMEDFDFVKRAKRKHHFHLIPKKVLVSARKYEQNHYLKVQFANILVFLLFRMGFSPNQLAKWYKALLF